MSLLAQHFDTFIPGPSNVLAHAVALQTIRSSKPKFNPFVLQGEQGTGKSHLLRAMQAHLAQEQGDVPSVWLHSAVWETSAEHRSEFLKRLQVTCPDVRTAVFLDEAQLLAETPHAVQEALAGVLDICLSQGRFVAVAIQCSPGAMPRFAPRLGAVLSSGILVEMLLPDVETKRRVARSFLAAEEIVVEEEAVCVLADSASDLRVLEQRINRTVALANFHSRGQLDHSFVLDNVLRPIGALPRQVAITQIIQVVASHFRLPPKTITGVRRTKQLVLPRYVAMHIARRYAGFSTTEIGRQFGNRDHTTVVHASKALEHDLEKDPALRTLVQQFAIQLGFNPRA